jgi:glucokinase
MKWLEERSGMSNDWAIGVDLGATKIACGLVSPDNALVVRTQVETKPLDGPALAAARITDSVRQLIGQAPAGAQLAGVGVCCPGPIDHTAGVIIDPPNLTGWRNVPFANMLSQLLGLPVKLEHDAKGTALAEFHLGAGRGSHDMVLIVIGTGIGAAVILDGKLYRGRHNAAGEVGHITVDLDGPICPCGSNGCVETYAGGPAIVRSYAYATRRQVSSAQEVSRAAEEGDPIAQRVLRAAGRALGAAIATMAMMLDIETFVLFGSVVKAGELLLEPAREAVPNYSHRSVSNRVRILTAGLGDQAGMLGAAWIARYQA